MTTSCGFREHRISALRRFLTADDVQKLRDAGWKEEQIAEAVYITALFAFFNRVADAFGVPSQSCLSMP